MKRGDFEQAAQHIGAAIELDGSRPEWHFDLAVCNGQIGRTVDAIAAYLLEGHPDQVTAVVSALGKGALPVAAFEQALGMKLPAVEKRLCAWIESQR